MTSRKLFLDVAYRFVLRQTIAECASVRGEGKKFQDY